MQRHASCLSGTEHTLRLLRRLGLSLTIACALSDARDLALVCELRLDLLVELELVLLDLHLGVVRSLARLHPPAVSSTAVVGTSVSN